MSLTCKEWLKENLLTKDWKECYEYCIENETDEWMRNQLKALYLSEIIKGDNNDRNK